MMRLGLAGLTFSIVSFSLVAAAAQPFHSLTADDFQGVPVYNAAGVIAYTNCTIDFRYKAHKEHNYYVLDFDIRLMMNNNRSWLDRGRVTSAAMLAEIVKHEQGHYNIAYLEQQELLRAVAKIVFYADYQRVAQDIFNRIDAKYKQLNRDYDDDTNHMINRAQQHSWDAYFKKQLSGDLLAQQ